VERLRLEAARLRVETTREPIDQVADAVGFGDPERMRRAFVRAFGQPPRRCGARRGGKSPTSAVTPAEAKRESRDPVGSAVRRP